MSRLAKLSNLAPWAMVILPFLAAPREPATKSLELLNFDDLIALSNTDQPASPLKEKLDRILGTPFLNNDATAAGSRPHRPTVDGLGTVLRVAEWNIERALNFDLIRLALSNPDGFT